MTMYTLKPSKVRESIIECFECGLVPFVTSSPGLGKSAIIAQIADEFNLEMIDIRLSMCAPEDLMGLPMRKDNGKATFATFEMFPTADTPLPEGKDGWILNLDEFNSAPRSVEAAAYKIALDRMAGQEKLHPACYIVAAGNLATDRAIVNQMSTAMQSRLAHIQMIVDHRDFMNHAHSAGFDHRILGFLELMPSKLQDFRPDHQDRTFACPRTWEFASRLIKGKSRDQINLPLLAGTISDGVAMEFYTFLAEYDKIPKFQDVIDRPEQIPMPKEVGTKYAVISMLLDNGTKTNFPDIIKYVKRLSPEFQVIFLRGAVKRIKDIRDVREYGQALLTLTEFMDDDDDDVKYAAAAA